MTEPETIGYFAGKPISGMTREELLGVIVFLAAENKSLRGDNLRWIRSGGDVLKYIEVGEG